MRVFWGNRDRHDRHDHPTHVTTTGTRIVEADNGHLGHNIVTVPDTNISSGTHVSRGGYHRRYSTARGLVDKMLGALMGNRHRRRRGEREMRKAREQRRAMRTAKQVERARETGDMNKLRKFRRRHRSRKHGHHGSDDPVVVSQDTGRHKKTPWMHYGSRALPPYHGAHHRVLGFFTRAKERRARGKAMAIAAQEHRRIERERRHAEMRDQGRRYRERRSPYFGGHNRFFGLFTGGRERRAREEALAIAAQEQERMERERRHGGRRHHSRRSRRSG